MQASPAYMEYRRVLRGVIGQIGSELGFQCTEAELNCLVDTLPEWPIFPDVTDALNTLKARYRLAVISNVDDDLFARTAEALNVDLRCRRDR